MTTLITRVCDNNLIFVQYKCNYSVPERHFELVIQNINKTANASKGNSHAQFFDFTLYIILTLLGCT